MGIAAGNRDVTRPRGLTPARITKVPVSKKETGTLNMVAGAGFEPATFGL